LKHTGEIQHTSIALARNSGKLRATAKNAKTYKKLPQFAGHGQNCELAAKRENCRKIAARKIVIFCKD